MEKKKAKKETTKKTEIEQEKEEIINKIVESEKKVESNIEKVLEKQKESGIEWYDNPNFITTVTITILALIIVLSQSFAVTNNLGTNDILRSLLNHNSIYLIGLLYFIPLKTLSGKKYFNYFNVFLILIYTIFTVTSVLTILQSFGLTSLINLGINIVLLIFMIHSLIKNTKVWKEFKLEKSPFNEIGSINYFYTIVILSIILLTINLIYASSFDGVILSILGTIYTCLLSRFIYLYSIHIDKKDNKEINLFYDIDKISKDLPQFKSVTNEMTSHELNNYQIIALVTFGVAFCVGIIFGNIFPSCGTTSGLYASKCATTEFNFSLTVAIWFIGFLVCVFFYGIGHIISLLDSINKNLIKKK